MVPGQLELCRVEEGSKAWRPKGGISLISERELIGKRIYVSADSTAIITSLYLNGMGDARWIVYYIRDWNGSPGFFKARNLSQIEELLVSCE